MARTVSEELVCDLCGTTTKVRAFTIVTDEGARVIDLCPGDSKPLLSLWNEGNAGPRQRKSTNSRATGHAVIPVD